MSRTNLRLPIVFKNSNFSFSEFPFISQKQLDFSFDILRLIWVLNFVRMLVLCVQFDCVSVTKIGPFLGLRCCIACNSVIKIHSFWVLCVGGLVLYRLSSLKAPIQQ